MSDSDTDIVDEIKSWTLRYPTQYLGDLAIGELIEYAEKACAEIVRLREFETNVLKLRAKAERFLTDYKPIRGSYPTTIKRTYVDEHDELLIDPNPLTFKQWEFPATMPPIEPEKYGLKTEDLAVKYTCPFEHDNMEPMKTELLGLASDYHEPVVAGNSANCGCDCYYCTGHD